MFSGRYNSWYFKFISALSLRCPEHSRDIARLSFISACPEECQELVFLPAFTCVVSGGPQVVNLPPRSCGSSVGARIVMVPQLPEICLWRKSAMADPGFRAAVPDPGTNYKPQVQACKVRIAGAGGHLCHLFHCKLLMCVSWQ